MDLKMAREDVRSPTPWNHPLHSPTNSPDAPRPLRRLLAFRLKTVMLVIAVIAAWLAIFREWPWPALAILWLAGPTAFFYAWFKKEAERDEGPPPGPILRAFFIFSALVVSIILTPLVHLAVVFFIGMIASLVSR